MGVVMSILIFGALVSLMGYGAFTTTLESQYTESAYRIADTAASVVNPYKLDKYLEEGLANREYVNSRARLQQLCNTQDATFIYVLKADTSDYKHITMVFNLVDRESEFEPYEIGYVRETTNEDYEKAYRELYENGAEHAKVVRNTGYIESGAHITALVPLKTAGGTTMGILCVQMPMDELTNSRHTFVTSIVITTGFLAIMILVIFLIFLRRKLLEPLEDITEEADRFARENTKLEFKIQDRVKCNNELGLLAGSIDSMEERIEEYVENLTRVTKEKEKLGTELYIASAIQEGMLPSTFPAFPNRKEFDIYATMDAAKEVGGDFYDFYFIDEDHLVLVIADVSGKGIPGALMMMSCKILINNSTMVSSSPGRMLEFVNNKICEHNPQEMFLTTWVGVLDLKTGLLRAANGGHEYPTIKRKGGEFELIKDKHGFVLGGMPDMPYSEYEIRLEPGDEIFVYTDGVPEATNEENELFGTERMLKSLNSNKDSGIKEKLLELRKNIDEFAGNAPQFDDITMLGFKYLG